MIEIKLKLNGPGNYYCESYPNGNEVRCEFCRTEISKVRYHCEIFSKSLPVDPSKKPIRCKQCIDATIKTNDKKKTLHRRGTMQNPFEVKERVMLRPRYNHGNYDKTGTVIEVHEFYGSGPYTESNRQSYAVLWDNDSEHEPVYMECHMLESLEDV